MSDTNRIGSIVAWGLMDTVWNLSYLVGVIVVMFVINLAPGAVGGGADPPSSP